MITISIVAALFFLFLAAQPLLMPEEAAAEPPFTRLETVLLQVLAVVVSLIGSFGFGRWSAKKAAKELVQPHARSAFRRVLFLVESLGRLLEAIGCARDGRGQKSSADLDVLEAIVTEQRATAIDAIEDWREIVRDDVEGLESRLRKQLKDKVEEPGE